MALFLKAEDGNRTVSCIVVESQASVFGYGQVFTIVLKLDFNLLNLCLPNAFEANNLTVEQNFNWEYFMNRDLARENDNIREMLNFLSMPASNVQELK